jgi:enoyl-CoA hydratase/carnithine racemase
LARREPARRKGNNRRRGQHDGGRAVARARTHQSDQRPVIQAQVEGAIEDAVDRAASAIGEEAAGQPVPRCGNQGSRRPCYHPGTDDTRGKENAAVATEIQPTDAPATDEVIVTRDGPVLTLMFNRPQARNAMTWNMYERLYQTCEEVDADDSIRVMVLRGAGGKAFVAGTDISQFTKFTSAEDGLAYERSGEQRAGRLGLVKKPVIAMVQGYAVGGGFAMTAVSDIRIATPDAKFGIPIARTLGNCLSMGNYSRLVDMLGPSRTKYMLMTASLISAEEMKTAGYVHEIVEPDKIEARTYELAEQIATYAPITLYVTKEAVRRIAEQRVGTGGEDLVELTYGSDDFREGVSAFLEKRKPNWTGR